MMAVMVSSMNRVRKHLIGALRRLLMRLLLRATASAGEGLYLSGRHWRGVWRGGLPTSREDISRRIDAVCAMVAEKICLDFGLRFSEKAVVSVACSTTRQGLADLLRAFGATSKSRADDCANRGALTWNELVFVAYRPDSSDFETRLAHELCHALCQRWLEVADPLPWVREGYAQEMSYRVRNGLPDMMDCDFWALLVSGECGRPGGIRGLLSVTDFEVVDEFYFRAHATVFLHYLRTLKDAIPGVWQFVNDSLAGKIAEPAAAEARLERASGMSLEALEGAFLKYCREATAVNGTARRIQGAQFRRDVSSN